MLRMLMIFICDIDLNRDLKSDDAHLGGDTNSIVFGSKMDVGFLLSIGSNKSVDCFWLNLIDFVESSFDLNFVSSGVDQENKSVAFGHGFVSLFSIEWVDEYRELIELGRHLKSRCMPEILGLRGNSQGSGLEESELGSNLIFAADCSLLCRLCGFGSLVDLVSLRTHLKYFSGKQ